MGFTRLLFLANSLTWAVQSVTLESGAKGAAGTRMAVGAAGSLEGCAMMTHLSSDDYMPGVFALHGSLQRVRAKPPLVVKVTRNVSKAAKDSLTARGIRVVDTEAHGRQTDADDHGPWENTFGKLDVFGETRFAKIVFLDADMIVLDNIDELCEKPHMSAALEGGWRLNRTFNSGLLVVEPSVAEHERITEILSSVSRKGISDQDILHMAYPKWPDNKQLHLMDGYNTQTFDLRDRVVKRKQCLPGWNEMPCEDKASGVKVVHFTCAKPWLVSEENFEDKCGKSKPMRYVYEQWQACLHDGE